MGIYDREYYRHGMGGGGFFSGLAPACKAFLLINVGAFLAQWVLRDLRLPALLAASSAEIFERGYIWQLLTAPFLHTDPWHLLVNMVVLWLAGRDVEAIYGSREFARMYLTAAVVSTLFWAVIDYFGISQGQGAMLGASGATTALFVIYALYYPRREFLLFFVLPMQVWLMLVIFLGIDFLMLLQEFRGVPSSAGVAFAAHLGGAAYGYLYKTYDLRWSRLLSAARSRPRLKVVSPTPREAPPPARPYETGRSVATPIASSPRPSPSVLYPDEQFDQRLDEILAKIAREGRGGLTEEENRILLEASRRARSRRSEQL